MQVSASHLLPFIVLLPLLGAAINGFFGRHFSRRTVHAIAVGSVAVSFVLALRVVSALMRIHDTAGLDPSFSYKAWTWAASGLFSFDVSFYVDTLSSVLLLVVTGVGLLIHIYSMGYMSDDKSYARYFAYLNLFTFSMLTLILGKNLLMLFVGWEGVGACSYLLIGFWFTDDQKAQAGQKAFVVNRIGDFGFVIGLILLMFHANGTTDYDVLRWHFERGGFGPFHDPYTLMACCLLLFVGATGKSAQIPLYVWLPDAMAGPTPVSALIHAATMVTAGVYMIARLSFMYTLSPDAMAVVACVGAATALFAATMAITQRDIKKVLAYSTVSQLGFMVLAVGVGAYVAGIFHLMTHAFFKALLFLGAGSVIHGMSGEQDIFKMGGLRKKMPITRLTFLIGCIAIAGVPFFSGFFSKDEILWDTLTKKQMVSLPQAARAGWSDGEHALIAGRHGAVLEARGNNWTRHQLAPADAPVGGPGQKIAPSIRAVTADAEGTFWAVGDYGTIYSGTSGAMTLRFQPEGPTRAFPLNAVWAKSSSEVWAVGDRGLVIRKSGDQFTTLDSGTAVPFHAIAAKAENDVYVGGAGGTLMHWNGQAFGKMDTGSSSDITGLAMVGADLWLATGQGALLKASGGTFERIDVKTPGLASLRGITAMSTFGGLVAIAAVGILDNETTPRPLILTSAGGAWTLSAGEPGQSLRTVLPFGEGWMGTTDGGALVKTAGATLVTEKTVPSKPWFHKLLYLAGLFTAFLTAFYMFRLYFLTFEGTTRADAHAWDHAHESPRSMTVPLMILAGLSIVGGYIGTPLFGHATEVLQHWMAPAFRIAEARLEANHHLSEAWFYAGLSSVIALAGIGLAYALYQGALRGLPADLARQFQGLYRLLYNKYYVDELYDVLFVRPFAATSRFVHRFVDQVVIDLILVRGPGYVLYGVGRVVRYVQTGDVQQYAVAIVVGLAAIAWAIGGAS